MKKDNRIDVIYEVDFGYNEYLGVDLPDSNKLMNFDFELSGKRWLYLDNYGDEILTTEIRERFFGIGSKESIAICFDNGDLALASLQEDEEKLCLYVRTFRDWLEDYCPEVSKDAYKVPKKYLNNLNELRYEKRPFFMDITSYGLFNFIDKEIGYSKLVESLKICLNLRKNQRLEIWSDSYRWVSTWKDIKRK